MAVKQVKVVNVPIDQLKAHPDNPRVGDVDAIAESIRINGFYGVIYVQQGTDVILAGTHRWQAAQSVGMKTIPVIYLEVDDAQAKKILLADNRTSDRASYDKDPLANLLKEVMHQSDLLGTGWDAKDLDKLIKESTDLPDKSEEDVELRPLERTYWLVAAPIHCHDMIESVLEGLPVEVEVASSQN